MTVSIKIDFSENSHTHKIGETSWDVSKKMTVSKKKTVGGFIFFIFAMYHVHTGSIRQ